MKRNLVTIFAALLLLLCGSLSAFAADALDITQPAEGQGITISYSKVDAPNAAYFLMLVKAGTDIESLNVNSILYIDQQQADANGKVTFANPVLQNGSGFYPKTERNADIYLMGAANVSSLFDKNAIPDGEGEYTGGGVYYANSPMGVTVSGIAASWNNTDDAVYLLYASSVSDADIKADMKLTAPQKALECEFAKETITANSDGKRYNQAFSFTVEEGEYKLAIYKPGKYVPKIISITVSDENIELGEVKLWLYGDVTYDGSADAFDATQILRHLNYLPCIFGTSDAAIEAERESAGNVSGEELDPGDSNQILRYINYLPSIFDTFN